ATTTTTTTTDTNSNSIIIIFSNHRSAVPLRLLLHRHSTVRSLLLVTRTPLPCRRTCSGVLRRVPTTGHSAMAQLSHRTNITGITKT
ncbi:hypothetical protein TCSYLVIO_001651, partial [Trypanosoma cruzi]